MLEPKDISPGSVNYKSDLARAFNLYNQDKDKKDARVFLKSYVGRDKSRLLDKVPDSEIVLTYGWMARMSQNGCSFKEEDQRKLTKYIDRLLNYKAEKVAVVAEEKPEKPSVRDYLEDKVKEYIGELEGVLDEVILNQREFSLLNDLRARTIPAQYSPFISAWIGKKAAEFIAVYETKDADIKNGYSNIGKRTLTSLLKSLNSWLEDLEKYTQFKKANRKPRVKKLKPAGIQVKKLKYKKEDTSLNIKSINPVDVVGASQVWVYNTKYRKLSVYRSDSKDGIQVKNSSLQNYDPSQCEQKAIKKPQEILPKVIEGGKIQLRRLLSDISTAETPVSGRINEDCIIVRAIR